LSYFFLPTLCGEVQYYPDDAKNGAKQKSEWEHGGEINEVEKNFALVASVPQCIKEHFHSPPLSGLSGYQIIYILVYSSQKSND